MTTGPSLLALATWRTYFAAVGRGLVRHRVLGLSAEMAFYALFSFPPVVLALSGAIACGRSILGAQALGADFAYIGSPWIATEEARALDGYKQAIVDGRAEDIVYSNLFTGVHGNYLRPSIVAAGLDPDNLPESDPSKMNFGSGGNSDAKAWKDIWGSGQGIGAVSKVESVADRVDRLAAEYHQAKAGLDAAFAPFAG